MFTRGRLRRRGAWGAGLTRCGSRARGDASARTVVVSVCAACSGGARYTGRRAWRSPCGRGCTASRVMIAAPLLSGGVRAYGASSSVRARLQSVLVLNWGTESARGTSMIFALSSARLNRTTVCGFDFSPLDEGSCRWRTGQRDEPEVRAAQWEGERRSRGSTTIEEQTHEVQSREPDRPRIGRARRIVPWSRGGEYGREHEPLRDDRCRQQPRRQR